MSLSTSRSLPRSVSAEREVLDGVEPILNARQRHAAGRTSHCRSSRPPIAVIVRSIASSSEPAAAAFGAFDDVQVPQRDWIDEQRVAADAQRDVADVGELGALGVPQVRDDRAGRGSRRGGASRAP